METLVSVFQTTEKNQESFIMANIIANPTSEQLQFVETLRSLLEEKGYSFEEFTLYERGRVDVKSTCFEKAGPDDPVNHSHRTDNVGDFTVITGGRYTSNDGETQQDYPLSFVHGASGCYLAFRQTPEGDWHYWRGNLHTTTDFPWPGCIASDKLAW